MDTKSSKALVAAIPAPAVVSQDRKQLKPNRGVKIGKKRKA